MEWHYKVKMQGGEIEEIPDYREGRILPFALVQKELLPEELAAIGRQKDKIAAFAVRFEELLELFPEDERTSDSFGEDGAEFVFAALREEAAGILKQKNPKAKQIAEYLAGHQEQESYEYKIVSVLAALEEEKAEKRKLRRMENELEEKTVSTIENLAEEEARHLLDCKWIQPLMAGLYGAADTVIDELSSNVKAIADKYADTFRSIEDEDRAASGELLSMVKELTGNEYDIDGLRELRRILGE